MQSSTGDNRDNTDKGGDRSKAGLTAAVPRVRGRNRWPKRERADWERALWESYADENDEDFEGSGA